MQFTGVLPDVVPAITTAVPAITSPSVATAANGFFHMEGSFRARGKTAPPDERMAHPPKGRHPSMEIPSRTGVKGSP